ncbi:MAG: murein biosynthesis integral membrane protein MurJ [Candidatus Magasanikbacteria bacterium CG_4_10_14_0_2_um_filter_37_12]|uniref:Probable lipid II flippase MurJ n=1 Tax=Candidatus Magasanikbacteria bacterium CG_4_10_14_0_2_um_filter_37_12 TaxID=1974637 RepID=A0A2M7V7V4_9BACT|nr:MAG: murein biosynthesis integral membrane protein MurJ [Candidatus Magasanikbacteria bacterium CG_4_10_14_0_2_um_filter_37_12]
MIKEIFSNKTKSITGAAIILGAASFLSRLIGIVRDRIFVHQFGAGDVLDAYYAAFRIPDLVYNLLIVGALSAGFIPIFMDLLIKDKEQAWRVTNSILNILSVLSLFFCSILFVFTPQIMSWIVPGFSGEKMLTTILLTRIMFISPIILGVSSVISGVLQSFKSFFIYSLTPIMYNTGIIIGAVFFVPIFGVPGLAYGVVLGTLLHILIQIPTLYKHGFKYQPLFEYKNIFVKKIGKLMIPRTLGMATGQFNLLAITVIASTLGAGSIAIFNLANNLQYFPIGIIGISFAVAAFPTLSQLVSKGCTDEMVVHLSKTIRQILFFIIPFTISFILLRAQIVRIILGTGEFGWKATILTADALALFAISLFAQCIIPLLARGFYALKDTWTPFLIGLVGALLNIILAIYFKEFLGVLGLALAFSIAMIVQMALLWIALRHKVGSLQESKVIFSLFKISIAGLIMAIAIQFSKAPIANLVDMEKFWGILIQGVVSGTIGFLIYVLVCYWLKLEEILIFKDSLQKKWLKLTSYQGEIRDIE